MFTVENQSPSNTPIFAALGHVPAVRVSLQSLQHLQMPSDHCVHLRACTSHNLGDAVHLTSEERHHLDHDILGVSSDRLVAVSSVIDEPVDDSGMWCEGIYRIISQSFPDYTPRLRHGSVVIGGEPEMDQYVQEGCYDLTGAGDALSPAMPISSWIVDLVGVREDEDPGCIIPRILRHMGGDFTLTVTWFKEGFHLIGYSSTSPLFVGIAEGELACVSNFRNLVAWSQKMSDRMQVQHIPAGEAVAVDIWQNGDADRCDVEINVSQDLSFSSGR